MTGAEWVTCCDPEKMLDQLRDRVTDRKLRLFAIACARRAWRSFSKREVSEEVLVGERFADGEVSLQALKAVRSRLGARGGYSALWAANSVNFAVMEEEADNAARRAAYYSACLVHFSIREMSRWNFERFKPAADAAQAAEREEQADVLRDVMGNPFSPSSLEVDWLTPDVVQLAREMYDQRDFKRMWVLADALEKVGCVEATALSHCRRLGEHFRGCWVVDAILGKA
jgi:hypothetical protein